MAQANLTLNAPCSCGSGKKYKNCCLENDTRRRKASKSRPLIIAGVVALVLIAVIVGYTRHLSSQPGPYDDLAKCITKKGFVMYGASWCPHCTDQKALFGKSVKHINYVECAREDGQGVKQVCKDKGIKQMPTWITPDGTLETGVKQLADLALESSCPLDNKAP